ncbi:Hypp698 [Branchiostoma lanceolatum]|uniref:Hypp698 protein n=1 Tax=Branchiostoma lanceolatum TaxID=7740 RepID=A0A8J9W551_BRALA|nr:Hypp698 [Branchiostoma lanceolatum]
MGDPTGVESPANDRVIKTLRAEIVKDYSGEKKCHKAERRERALEKVKSTRSATWTEKNKRRAGRRRHTCPPSLSGTRVRKLAWESKSLRKLKDSVDKVCPQRGAARVPSAEVSVDNQQAHAAGGQEPRSAGRQP